MTAFPGKRRVFFGHQSVGSNIIDGIRLVSPKSRIFEHSVNRADHEDFGFFHASIGQNGNPKSKIDEFAEIIQTSSSDYHIAMMKLCYVDIGKGTDVRQLFHYYTSIIDELQHALPWLQIVHLTTPLRSTRLGIRSRARLLMGHSLDPVEDNIQREAYNSLVRSKYGDSQCFLDLARIEATRPDGGASVMKYRGQLVRSLFSGYSSDGGHLNSSGKRIIAREFIKLIEEL